LTKHPNSDCPQELANLKQLIGLRRNREGRRGFFVWLWDIAFGSDETATEVERIKERLKLQESHVRTAMVATATQIDRDEKENAKRVNNALQFMDEANDYLSKFEERFQVIDDKELDRYVDDIALNTLTHYEALKARYDRIRNKELPWTEDELTHNLNKARNRLPKYTMLPPINRTMMRDVFTITVSKNMETINLTVSLPLVHVDEFTMMRITPVPERRTGRVLNITPRTIFINKQTGKYFYQGDKQEIQTIGTISLVENRIFQDAHTKTDCITAHIMQEVNEIDRYCKWLDTRATHGVMMTEITPLNHPNQFLLSTNEVNRVNVDCNNEKYSPHFVEKDDSLSVNLLTLISPCQLFTPSENVFAEINQQTKLNFSRIFISKMILRPNYTHIEAPHWNHTGEHLARITYSPWDIKDDLDALNQPPTPPENHTIIISTGLVAACVTLTTITGILVYYFVKKNKYKFKWLNKDTKQTESESVVSYADIGETNTANSEMSVISDQPKANRKPTNPRRIQIASIHASEHGSILEPMNHTQM
jgi:hypothetical protein